MSPRPSRICSKQSKRSLPTDVNVVITGETGTGKELVARALHNLSSRKHKTLIKVNCASIPKELFESEFFGHVRGAFTGALRDRVGRFELADKGTLFLARISDMAVVPYQQDQAPRLDFGAPT